MRLQTRADGLDYRLVRIVVDLLSVYLNVDFTVVARLFDGILEHVEQNLLVPLKVTPHFLAILHDFKHDRDLFWVDRAKAIDHCRRSLLQIKLANVGS